jgi:hypothetical protein
VAVIVPPAAAAPPATEDKKADIPSVICKKEATSVWLAASS